MCGLGGHRVLARVIWCDSFATRTPHAPPPVHAVRRDTQNRDLPATDQSERGTLIRWTVTNSSISRPRQVQMHKLQNSPDIKHTCMLICLSRWGVHVGLHVDNCRLVACCWLLVAGCGLRVSTTGWRAHNLAVTVSDTDSRSTPAWPGIEPEPLICVSWCCHWLRLALPFFVAFQDDTDCDDAATAISEITKLKDPVQCALGRLLVYVNRGSFGTLCCDETIDPCQHFSGTYMPPRAAATLTSAPCFLFVPFDLILLADTRIQASARLPWSCSTK